MSYGDDDIREWAYARRKERMAEVFSPMKSIADVGPDRYDELARRQMIEPVMTVLEQVINGTFGQNIAEAYTSRNELYEFAEEIASALVISDRWKNIRGKIKGHEDEVF